MSDGTNIEWADASWPVAAGCTHISAGCDNCYAAKLTSGRLRHLPDYAGLAERGKFNGQVRLAPHKLDWPLKWRKPRRIFVASMSDLFHEGVSWEYIARVWAVMAATPRHEYQVLTKRHGRMRSLLSLAKVNGFHDAMVRALFALGFSGGVEWPLPNVWLGVSAENQQWADIRIPALLDTPAAVRWVSAEPLLGALDLGRYMTGSDEHVPWNYTEFGVECMCKAPMRDERCTAPGLDWVVVGGESGPGARPMQTAWARSIRDQCVEAGVAFFMKQWGEWVAPDQMPESTFMDWDIANGTSAYDRSQPWRVGKKRAGRELDGRTWDEYPATKGSEG